MLMMIGSTQLNYVIEGEGIPIIIIHGKSVDHRLMYGCLEPIFTSTTAYKRIYFDIPGMGRSNLGDDVKADSDLIDIFVKAITQLIDKERFLLIGESFGCHLARGILQEMVKQVIGVTYICPWIADVEQNIPERKVLVRDDAFIDAPIVEEKEYFSSIAVVATKDTYDLFVRDIWPGIKLFNGKGFDKLIGDLVFDRSLVFDGPSLFITARQDHWVGYEATFKLLQEYPRATYSVLDCAGHSVQIERIKIFESLILDWLDRTIIC